jgi:hypothetical protein
MQRMTLQKLADMMELGFTEILGKLGVVQDDVKVLKQGQERLENRMDKMDRRMGRFERGQEDIILWLDSKANKIDFPEVYPQFKK